MASLTKIFDIEDVTIPPPIANTSRLHLSNTLQLKKCHLKFIEQINQIKFLIDKRCSITSNNNDSAFTIKSFIENGKLYDENFAEKDLTLS